MNPTSSPAAAGRRATWGSRLGFVLAAAGSAVGLGNVWKFPYVTGENGGGLFVLLYLGAVFLVGVPVMVAEIVIGRRGQGSPVTAFLNLRGGRSRWGWLGWIGVVAGFVILSYYGVVAGWTLDYLVKSLSGAFWNRDVQEIPALFDTLYGNALANVGWLVVFMALTIGVVLGGVQKGIERCNLVLMPALFLILVGLFLYATQLEGFGRAMDFLLRPRLESFKGGASVLEAMGQAFFSLSLGMGAMLTYGSYLRRDADVLKSAVQISLLDVLVALLSGAILFPVIFSFGFEPQAGPGLVFKTLPVIFAQLGPGRILAPLFFLLLVFAALTSAVSLLEVVSATLIERLRWTRTQAVLVAGTTITAFGLLSALSGSSLAGVTLLGGRSLFDSFDYLASNWILPLGGIGISIFAGWVLSRKDAEDEYTAGARFPGLFRTWRQVVGVVCPVAVALVFLKAVGLLGMPAEVLNAHLTRISGWIWGAPLLVLLVGTGVFLTVRLRGVQFWGLGRALHLAFVVRHEKGAEGDISHFQALMTALAATVGTGNIAGVATAIALGGPGALFWMWITGLFGMATKYGEAVLAIRFRTTDRKGRMAGGPMYYLRDGLKQPWLGATFALFAAIAAFGIGNLVQVHSVASAAEVTFGVPPRATGLVLAALTAAVLLFGIKGIGRVTAVLVPVMILAYMAGALVLLARHLDLLPGAVALVFKHAFTPTAAAGGFAGSVVRQAVRYGVARGVFSNESGLGSAPIAAAAAQTSHPVTQALVSMTQTFIDTIVVCSLTGLAIVVTGAWTQVDASGAALTGSPLTLAAFSQGIGWSFTLGGTTWDVGALVVTVGLVLFAYSTILGWSYYGEKSVEYLLGERSVVPYRVLFVALVAVGAVMKVEVVWNLSDCMNGLMALPNLVGLLLLSGIIAKETRDYFARPQGVGAAEPPDAADRRGVS